MPSPQPTWWKDGICYQIWPASYRDSNGDGLGDIPGILSTLDYLRDLGIDIIWLSPMYKSPQVDMGYDISDYENIHPPFGTMQDMDNLIAEVHKRGMRIILDLVINHTSDQHRFFIESRKSKDNKYSDYYMWQPPKYNSDGTRRPPNNWRAAWGGSAWEYVSERDEYYLHLFSKEQPDLNWENPEARRAIYETAIEYWLKKGVDGFRVDVVNCYSKDISFPDAKVRDEGAEFQWGFEHCMHGPRIHEFLKEIRKDVLDKYGEVMMVGECGMADRAEILRYVSAGEKELDMIFDFIMLRVGLEGMTEYHHFQRHTLPQLKAAIEESQHLVKDTKDNAWVTVVAENHDSTRSLSRFATDDARFRTKAGKLLAIMLATLTGTLFMYQGEEIGMSNLPSSWTMDDFRDIGSLNYWKDMSERYAGDEGMLQKAKQGLYAVSRDNCRTPVQWNAGPNAGFCEDRVTPWIKVHENYKEINVAAAQKDPDSILAMWKQVLRLRKRKECRDVLVYGSFEIWNAEDENVFTYVKGFEGTKVLVMLNFSEGEQEVDVPSGLKGKDMELLIANVGEVGEKLGAWEGRAYLVNEKEEGAGARM